jgi:hypothetical protein
VLLKETLVMTAPSSIDPARFLHEQLASASPDLLRSMLSRFINTLMSRWRLHVEVDGTRSVTASLDHRW